MSTTRTNTPPVDATLARCEQTARQLATQATKLSAQLKRRPLHSRPAILLFAVCAVLLGVSASVVYRITNYPEPAVVLAAFVGAIAFIGAGSCVMYLMDRRLEVRGTTATTRLAERIVAAGAQHGPLVQQALTTMAMNERIAAPGDRDWDGDVLIAIARMTTPQTLLTAVDAGADISWLRELRASLSKLAGRGSDWAPDALSRLVDTALASNMPAGELRMLAVAVRTADTADSAA